MKSLAIGDWTQSPLLKGQKIRLSFGCFFLATSPNPEAIYLPLSLMSHLISVQKTLYISGVLEALYWDVGTKTICLFFIIPQYVCHNNRWERSRTHTLQESSSLESQGFGFEDHHCYSLSITNDLIVHSATFWRPELDTSTVFGLF